MACEACNNLKKNSATFAQNGVTTAVCNSLKNDTGFSSGNSHNDCTDLDLANDCLIGDMAEEVEIYDVCEWKEFATKFVGNAYQVFKAIICAICGIWTNIWALWEEVNSLKARVKAIEDYINNTLKPWITTINNWKTEINNWKSEINTWKSQINSWKDGIDTWKSQMTSWKSTIDSWKSDMTTWKSTIDSWKSTMTTWKSTIDSWKSTIDSWKTTISTTVSSHTTSISKLNHNMDVAKCYFTHMNENSGGAIHAYVDDDPTKARLNGFRIASGIKVRSGSAPMNIAIIGSTARITGSLQFYSNMPANYRNGGSSSNVKWLDFFNGGTEITTHGNQSSYQGNTPSGNLFLYEYEVNPCDFGFKSLYATNLFSADGGDFQCRVNMYRDGDTYPYDYGWGPNGEGDGQTFHASSSGNVLIQVRLVNVRTWGITRTEGNVTPNGIVMVTPCPSNWSCGSWQ